ncbi:MAG: sulfur carrier protein ThiS [Bdellovibrionales bacterium]|nr:sulfur carrier protein ThiS [Bdellovibrionales bacterium]
MRVVVNGEPREAPPHVSLLDLLRTLDMEKPYIAVCVNMSCVPKFQFESFELQENDEIEILVPYQGG